MTSYRGVEIVDCVGMQPVAEPAHGLCVNHKPNRFLGIERKRIIGPYVCKALYFFRRRVLPLSYRILLMARPNAITCVVQRLRKVNGIMKRTNVDGHC